MGVQSVRGDALAKESVGEEGLGEVDGMYLPPSSVTRMGGVVMCGVGWRIC